MSERLAAVLLLFAVPLGAQTTWHVDVNASGPGTGTPADPFVSIQAGINAAASGDSVLVEAGTYVENLDLLGKDIVVRALGGPENTTISAAAANPTVVFANGETAACRLDGFTVRDGAGQPYSFLGFTHGAGGGIHCASSSPTIARCIIRNNTGGDGAGINPTCLFAPINAGWGGGGGVHLVLSQATLLDCVIRDNVGGDGGYGFYDPMLGPAFGRPGGAGGVAAFGSSPTLVNCRVFGNAGGKGGDAEPGGFFLSPPEIGGVGGAGGVGTLGGNTSFTMIGCEITSNTGAVGQDVCANAFVAAGYPEGGAGGVHGAGTLTNCTVAGNLGGTVIGSPPSAAGIGGLRFTGTVINSIVRFNVAGSGSVPADAGAGVTFTDSNVPPGTPGTGNLFTDPLFVSTVDFRLTSASPCVDAAGGSVGGLPQQDPDGHPRVFYDGLDMGAFEFVSACALGDAEAAGLLTANGSSDLVVTVGVGQPLALAVAQPAQVAVPADFAIAGMLGVPSLSDEVGVGPFCLGITPQLVDPSRLDLFTVANTFIPDPNALVAAAGTPFNLFVPGIAYPAEFTLQAVVLTDPGALDPVSVTNVVVIRVQ